MGVHNRRPPRATVTRPSSDAALQWLPPVLTAAAAVALYAYTIRLPLFRDAMVMLRWMDRRSVAQFWVDARGFPYYRPLAWMFLKAFQFGPGQFHVAGLHVQNVVLHALNGALVSLLAWRLWDGQEPALSLPQGRVLFALLSGLIFVSYPFSYEVIPVVGPIFQLVVTALILGATLLYWESRVRGSRALGVISLALGLACPFASEYGVTLGLLLLAVEWLEHRRGRFRRCSWNPLIYLGCAAMYVGVWFLVPKSRGQALPLLSLAGLGRKGVYFLQGLVFPVAPLVEPLSADMPGGGYGLVFALAVLTLGALAAFLRRARRGHEMAFGLVWFAVGVLPLWPTLTLDYVLNGPRLFYVASAGAAMLWAGLVAALATRPRPAWLGRLAGAALALGILYGSVTFLARMQDVLTTGGEVAADVVAVAAAHEDTTPLLFVNFPSWLAPKGHRFPLGREGISILPGYSDTADLVYINTGRQMNLRNVTATIIWQDWLLKERFYTPPLGLVELAPELRWAERVYVVQSGPAGLRLAEAGWVSASSPPGAPQAVFAERFFLRLDRFTASPRASSGGGGRPSAPASVEGEELAVHLEWWSEAPVEDDVTVFLHVYDEGGGLVAQVDGYPLLGLYPAWAWGGGEVVHDVRRVTLPPDLPPGRYRVGVGMYCAEGQGRLRATDTEGHPLSDDVAILAAFERP